ncbi:hypothetical protein NDU88_004708 [Pleurodeles waltl]|uniref:Uncharacterized protein n=1 Tax=Pleurodeles waltl TaxID=8319 RepID=A0AAV7NK81_PLEWA|nr:hypothetical protein NDU88_004708 [Pleurodeles waltl]
MLPPGARGPESPEGIPSRGSGEAHEAGAPSRSTHREPISKRRGGWREPRPETAADQAPLGVFRAPVLFPLDRGRPQRPSPPRTPKESARAGDSRRQAPQHTSSPRAPAAARTGSRSLAGVSGGESQGSAPFTATRRISYVA